MSESNNIHNDFLPDELMLNIYLRLDLKSVIQAGSTCGRWKILLESNEIWSSFLDKIPLFFKTEVPKDQSTQSYLIGRTIALINITKKDAKAIVGTAVYLSRLGLSTLTKALTCVQNITDEEAEKKPHEKDNLYYLIGSEFLENNEISEAEKIVQAMSKTTCRSVLAFNIFKHSIKINDLEKALSMMQFIKDDQLESNVALSILIWNSEQTNQVNIALKALKN